MSYINCRGCVYCYFHSFSRFFHFILFPFLRFHSSFLHKCTTTSNWNWIQKRTSNMVYKLCTGRWINIVYYRSISCSFYMQCTYTYNMLYTLHIAHTQSQHEINNTHNFLHWFGIQYCTSWCWESMEFSKVFSVYEKPPVTRDVVRPNKAYITY